MLRPLQTLGAQVMTHMKAEKADIVVIESEASLFEPQQQVASARAWQAVQAAGPHDSRGLPLWLSAAIAAGALVYEADAMRAFLLQQTPRQLSALASPGSTFRPHANPALLAIRQPAPAPAPRPAAPVVAAAPVAPVAAQVVRLSGAGNPTEHTFARDKRGASTVPQLHPAPPAGVSPFWREGESELAVGRKPVRIDKARMQALQRGGTCELCSEEFKALEEHLASAKHRAAFQGEWRYRYLDYECH